MDIKKVESTSPEKKIIETSSGEGLLKTESSEKKVVSFKDTMHKNRWVIVAIFVGTVGVALVGLGVGFPQLGNIGAIASISSGGALLLGTITTVIIVAVRQKPKAEATPEEQVPVEETVVENKNVTQKPEQKTEEKPTEKKEVVTPKEELSQEELKTLKSQFFHAAYNKQEIESYLKKNSDIVNAATEDKGWTAAHYAAWNGNLDNIKMLHQYGANFELKNSEEKTVLDVATQYKNQNVIDFLSGLKK